MFQGDQDWCWRRSEEVLYTLCSFCHSREIKEYQKDDQSARPGIIRASPLWVLVTVSHSSPYLFDLDVSNTASCPLSLARIELVSSTARKCFNIMIGDMIPRTPANPPHPNTLCINILPIIIVIITHYQSNLTASLSMVSRPNHASQL